jgi:PAS domain S-box-containing protein
MSPPPPLAPASVAAVAARGPAAGARGALGTRRTPSLLEQLEPGGRVLVVGAAPDLGEALPRAGFAISHVETIEALAVFAGTALDALVVDARQWSADAWCEAIAAHGLDTVPTILVLEGADDDQDDDARARAYNALDTLGRPLCRRVLARRLRVATELGRQRRAATITEVALGATGHGITLADAHQPDLPLVYANAGFERLTGWRAGDVIGQNCRFLQSSRTDPAALERVRGAVRLGHAVDARLENRRRDGTHFWNDLSIRPVTDGGGHLRYLVGVQRDITPQVEAERVLARGESTAFLDMILEELPAGVLTADAAGRTTFVNRAGLAVLGLEGTSHGGAPLREVLGCPNDLVIGRERRRHEYVVRRPDGREIELGLTITPTAGLHPEIHHFVLFRDLTPDREAEQTHRRVERLAAMGTMVAGFAHEVRNPVTAMRSVLDTLDEETPLGDTRRIYILKLVKHLERVERLVKSSLTFGRPDSPRRSRVSPARLVDEAIEQMRARTGTLGAIHRDVAEHLPDIYVDELHLTQVLVALLNNALEAAVYPDQVTLRARVDDDGLVSFAVEDNGPGIPRHVLGRMFDPFFTTKSSGTGLGLSIAQRLAHDNGATIDVASTLGQGSRLRVRLPPATSPGPT